MWRATLSSLIVFRSIMKVYLNHKGHCHSFSCVLGQYLSDGSTQQGADSWGGSECRINVANIMKKVLIAIVCAKSFCTSKYVLCLFEYVIRGFHKFRGITRRNSRCLKKHLRKSRRKYSGIKNCYVYSKEM